MTVGKSGSQLTRFFIFGSMENQVEKQIALLTDPICRDLGLELFLIQYTDAGKHSVLKVFIDRPEQDMGVSIEDCIKVSRALSVNLDVEDIIGHAYTLEVSSPGLDRLLRGPDDFISHLGRKVKIVTVKAIGKGNQTTFQGTLVNFDDGIATIQTPKGDVRIEQKIIKRANLEIEVGDLR